MGKNIYIHAELYACCRDGIVKENHRPTKTAQKRKQRGSRKLSNGYCLSRMLVTTDKGRAGTVCVKYIKTHTNHTPGLEEVNRLPLPSTVREEVKLKFNQHMQLDAILDGKYKSHENRNTACVLCDCSRICILFILCMYMLLDH